MGFFIYILIFLLFLIPGRTFSWDRHDLLTTLSLQEVRWLDQFNTIRVTPFEHFLKKAFSRDFTKKDFEKQYHLNPGFRIEFRHPKGPKSYAQIGEITAARLILSNYTDEPDWGMDQNLNMFPYQKYMGGTTGPTSRAFRHMYFKKWSLSSPFKTFHIPPYEMGEALQRAQVFYNLAEMAFEASEPYWAFRFLAWSIHYIQDIGQPFHSAQLLTPKFVAWNDLFDFNTFVKRTTQILANYHWMYEAYVSHKLQHELNKKEKGVFASAMRGSDVAHSSSALLIAKHASDFSNRFSFEIGEACFAFFGKKFLDPAVDVPNSPPGTYPVNTLDQQRESEGLSKKQREIFLKNTAKNLEKTALYTRSLLELAREEFLKK